MFVLKYKGTSEQQQTQYRTVKVRYSDIFVTMRQKVLPNLLYGFCVIVKKQYQLLIFLY